MTGVDGLRAGLPGRRNSPSSSAGPDRERREVLPPAGRGHRRPDQGPDGRRRR
ncbi:MAG: hypothetical protein M0C28_35970 [Candidatus Moduliflexus flocculans]|nr:hypothetical protein [Candidatus Moduliflexus flocculans]